MHSVTRKAFEMRRCEKRLNSNFNKLGELVLMIRARKAQSKVKTCVINSPSNDVICPQRPAIFTDYI